MEENKIQTEENEVLAETPFQENVETVVQEEQPVLTKKQLRLEKKLQRKQKRELKKTPEYQRAKIDRLISKQNIKFRGPFSYRTVRIFAYIFMLFAQVYLIYSLACKITTPPDWTKSLVNILEILSVFALPLFITANFCIIMSSKKDIKSHLIINSIIAILIYLSIILIHYRYVGGLSNIIFKDNPELANSFTDALSSLFFGKIINYNIFVDLALFSLFFFFFFYTPQKIKSKKGLTLFRICSIFPVLIAVCSSLLYALHYLSFIKLPVAALAIMPCRSFTFYAIFFALSIVIKYRKHKFIKMGGTRQEYEAYSKSNRSSLEISIIASIIIFVVCLIDFILLLVEPMVLLLGIGTNFYFVFIIPFIFLLSYTRKPKLKALDYILPIIFIVAVIIVYLEGFLLLLGSI